MESLPSHLHVGPKIAPHFYGTRHATACLYVCVCISVQRLCSINIVANCLNSSNWLLVRWLGLPQTTGTCDICSNRPHLRIACGRCGL